MSLTLYNGNNTQNITIAGLTNASGSLVSDATITGTLVRNGVALGGSLSFSPLSGTAGSYVATLASLSAAIGPATLQVSGTEGGVSFSFNVYVTVAVRCL